MLQLKPPRDEEVGLQCNFGFLLSILQTLSLRLQVYHSSTRTQARLLGPCFKTGGSGLTSFLALVEFVAHVP